jgi:hypothetical protein
MGFDFEISYLLFKRNKVEISSMKVGPDFEISYLSFKSKKVFK